jgi:hypothetical protein
MPTSPSPEHRRSRRLEIGRLVAGQLVPSGAAIKIRDIGFGGIAMETSSAVRVGSILDLRFTSKDQSSFVLRARVAHTRRISGPSGPALYLSGLEFADKQSPRGQQAIDALLEKVDWVLSFYHDAAPELSKRPPSQQAAQAFQTDATHRRALARLKW